MVFKYQNSITRGRIYENIEPLSQLKLISYNAYGQIPIMANYEGKIEYFYARGIYSDNANFDVSQYMLSLPVIDVQNLDECRYIYEICSNRESGNIENYLASKVIQQELFSFFSMVATTNTTTVTTTVTSTTVTTTPCPTGVLSRVYYIDITYICAICVATNEFVCSPYANYNYDNCLNSANSINQGNTDCTTTTSTTTTTLIPTTSPEPTSTTPIGPQG